MLKLKFMQEIYLNLTEKQDRNMKICEINKGVSGLSIAQMLNVKHNVTIYEKNSFIEGIAKTKQVNEASYHMIGGHCMNSKNKDVLNIVFDMLPENEWDLVKKNAKIYLDEKCIPNPIEFSRKEMSVCGNR
jgi:protoporphyrinogen oxidase